MKAHNTRSGRVGQGRFPANFIHDGTDEVKDLFPQTGKSSGGQSGVKKSGLTYSSIIWRKKKTLKVVNLVIDEWFSK